MQRTNSTRNLADVLHNDAAPEAGFDNIRQQGRVFGVFDRADVNRVAQNPQQIAAVARAIIINERDAEDAANNQHGAPAA